MFADVLYAWRAMANINETLYVQCPYVRARQYLEDAVKDAAHSGLPQSLELTALVPATKVEVAKRVRITYAPATDPMHFDEPWKVHWAPEAGGIFPSFSGQLTVRADESYRSCILEITGTYTPPLGAAGRIFDVAIGNTIAAATAQRLLEQIAADMIQRRKVEEAAKMDSGGPSS